MSDNKISLNNSSKESYSPVRVVSFNILHGKRPEGRADLDALLQDLADLDGEIVGLQEVDHKTLRVRFHDLTGMVAKKFGFDSHYMMTKRWFPVGTYGNALFSRYGLKDIREIRLKRMKFRWEGTGAIVATSNVRGLEWRIGTTHLSWHREESFEQLRQALAAFDGFEGPSILFGDFNMRPHEITPVVESLGWTVAETDFTYPSWDPQFRIDYVLCRNCEAVSGEARTMRLSDHRGLVVMVQPSPSIIA